MPISLILRMKQGLELDCLKLAQVIIFFFYRDGVDFSSIDEPDGVEVDVSSDISSLGNNAPHSGPRGINDSVQFLAQIRLQTTIKVDAEDRR